MSGDADDYSALIDEDIDRVEDSQGLQCELCTPTGIEANKLISRID